MTHNELAELTRYMRLSDDDPDTDQLISQCYSGAVSYLQTAGCIKTEQNAGLYNIAVRRLTLFYFDQPASSGSEAAIPNGRRPIITQLKLSQ